MNLNELRRQNFYGESLEFLKYVEGIIVFMTSRPSIFFSTDRSTNYLNIGIERPGVLMPGRQQSGLRASLHAFGAVALWNTGPGPGVV